jgi:hypothetical protein
MDPQLIEAIKSVGEPNWTTWVEIGVAIAGCALTIGGFFIVIRALHGDTHSKLYVEDVEILKVFLEHDKLRPYFYEGKSVDEQDQKHCGMVHTLAETFSTHFEHVLLQTKNLPKHIRPRWKDVIKSFLRTSPAIRQHIEENKDWYSSDLVEIARTQAREPARDGA